MSPPDFRVALHDPGAGATSLHAPDSPEAEVLLDRAGPHPRRPGPCDRRAGAHTAPHPDVVGLKGDAVFGSRRENWRPDLPDAWAGSSSPCSGSRSSSGPDRVPQGGTAKFLRDRRLPD